jgi:hypothetical protein
MVQRRLKCVSISATGSIPTLLKVMDDYWPFDQDKNVAAITTRQVLREGHAVLRVVHYSDDHSWAFTCGTTSDPKDALVVSMKSMVELDPTLFPLQTCYQVGVLRGKPVVHRGNGIDTMTKTDVPRTPWLIAHLCAGPGNTVNKQKT